MRITLIGPVYPYRGGISHYTGALASALATSGHPVQVISFNRQYPAWLYPGKTDRDPSQKPIQTTAEYLLDPLYPWTWQLAAQRILAFESDLAVIQWWTTFWGPAFAVLSRLLGRRGRRVAYLIHNVLPHEPRRWDAPLARLALNGGFAHIAQTRREEERLLMLLPGARIYSCPHPTYHALHDNPLSQSEARRRLDLPPDRFILLFFGFVRPYKGIHVLLEALGRLQAEGSCPYLVIAGELWQDRRGYENQIKQLGLSGQVRVEDRYIPNEEISAWYSSADCLVAPYTAGTQSGAAAIALAYGLPLIASQTVADGIAAEHRAALLEVVPPGEAAALAQAILRAMDTPVHSLRRTPVAGDDWQKLVETLERIAAGGGR